ncbi:MAG TPA: response regulator, partial [Gaiellaceae bacterium]
MNKTVVVIDDEPSVQEVTRAYLEKDGYSVFVAGTGSDGIALAERLKPGLIVLDLMLPDIAGEEICREIRPRSDVPILMLTAKAAEDERVNGLALGADDYLTKPFSPRELVARMKAIFRRTDPQERHDSFSLGDVVLDRESHDVTVAGKPVELTAKEFDLLAFFMANAGVVVSRDLLLDRVW